MPARSGDPTVSQHSNSKFFIQSFNLVKGRNFLARAVFLSNHPIHKI